jgi:hypothetical protein
MRYLPYIALGAVLLLSSCGSVKSSSTAAPGTAAVRAYDRVVVRDFTHTVKDDDGTTPIAAKRFADHIVTAIQKAKPGARVTRGGAADARTVVVSGEVTRYMEGNAALRLLIGMGAGSSYFDANVRLTDGTGKALSTIVVDKNSWGLGGIGAATQTVDTFMVAGAEKTAKEVAQHLR